MKAIKITFLLLFFSVNISFGQFEWDGSTDINNAIYRNGNIGIGLTSVNPPNAPLQFAASTANRKIVLYEHANNNYQFYGFGVLGNILKYQVPTSSDNHVFYSGASSSTEAELMRIQGNGNVGIGTSTPASQLHLKSTSAEIFLETFNYNHSKLVLGGSSNKLFEIDYYQYPACPSPRVRIGPVNATRKAIFFPSVSSTGNNKIIFSNNERFGLGSCQGYQYGITGTYLFDEQVGAASLMVMAPIQAATYPTLPTGYIFGVIGNSNMNGTLQINNETNTVPDNTITGLSVSNTTTGSIPYSWIQTESAKPLALNPIPSSTSYIAIGFAPGDKTVPTGYKLAVDGNIICTELKVKASGNWPDYVFSDSYNLLPLDSVAHYVSVNKHLPEVPSSEEVEKEGINTGEMDQILLKKIEELTLYMIEQKRAMDEQKKEIEQLKAQNQELVEQVSEFSK